MTIEMITERHPDLFDASSYSREKDQSSFSSSSNKLLISTGIEPRTVRFGDTHVELRSVAYVEKACVIRRKSL